MKVRVKHIWRVTLVVITFWLAIGLELLIDASCGHGGELAAAQPDVTPLASFVSCASEIVFQQRCPHQKRFFFSKCILS